MKTGVDYWFDHEREDGIKEGLKEGIKEGQIVAAVTFVKSGMTVQEVSDRLELSEEQILQLEIRLGLKKELA